MSTVYKLPYTGNEIKEKIGQVDKNTTHIGELSEQIDDINKDIYTESLQLELPAIYKGKGSVTNIADVLYSGTFNVFELMNVKNSEFITKGLNIKVDGTKVTIKGTCTESGSVSYSKGESLGTDVMRNQGGGYTLPEGDYYFKLFIEKYDISNGSLSISIINNNGGTITDLTNASQESVLLPYAENWGQLYSWFSEGVTYDVEFNFGLFIGNFNSLYRTEKTSTVKKITSDGVYNIGELTWGDSQAIVKTVKLKTDEIEQQIKNSDNGKTIAWFGDSLSQLQLLPHRVGELMGATVYDCSIAGGMLTYDEPLWQPLDVLGMAQSIVNEDFTSQDNAVIGIAQKTGVDQSAKQENVNNLKSIDFTSLDKIVIFSGTNDSYNNDYVATSTDLTKFKEGMKEIIEIFNVNFPHIRLFFITPPYRGDYTGTDKHGNKLIDFVNAELEVCRELHIPILDFYHNCGINDYNITYYLNDDLLHQNENGDILWAEKISKWLMSVG